MQTFRVHFDAAHSAADAQLAPVGFRGAHTLPSQ